MLRWDDRRGIRAFRPICFLSTKPGMVRDVQPAEAPSRIPPICWEAMAGRDRSVHIRMIPAGWHRATRPCRRVRPCELGAAGGWARGSSTDSGPEQPKSVARWKVGATCHGTIGWAWVSLFFLLRRHRLPAGRAARAVPERRPGRGLVGDGPRCGRAAGGFCRRAGGHGRSARLRRPRRLATLTAALDGA